tara:strand:+ start:293881 stop:294219 length:339 start_codon:yes stop_codon:yes gene_type:complete
MPVPQKEFSMKSETNTPDAASVAKDFEELTKQLAVLREDIAKLAQSVGSTATKQGHDMSADIAEGLEEAQKYVERKGRSAEAQFEASVTTHPFMAIGLAAVAGLLVGLASRR